MALETTAHICGQVFENVLEDICSYLFSAELKNLGDAAVFLRSALHNASDEVKWRLAHLIRWCRAGGGAQICAFDTSVAFNDGNWYPGGVALADLQITLESNLTFRLEVSSTVMSLGDVLVGLTRRVSTASKVESAPAFESGFEYILGRGSAPASIFVGYGYAGQCWSSHGDGNGPFPDNSSECASSDTPQLRCKGEWLEFQCIAGAVSAKHSSGNFFSWNTKIDKGEIWQPTLAWMGRGNVASIRILRTRSDSFQDFITSFSECRLM